MKIKNKLDVEKLRLKIKNDLGIDMEKYRKPEIVEDFVDLLAFPKYVLTWTLVPVLLFMLAYVVGFYKLDLNAFEKIIYAVMGLVLFFVNGLFAGFLLTVWQIKSDVKGIINYSLDIMKTSVKDIKQLKNVAKKEVQNPLNLLFKGLVHIITIPTVLEVIENKIPLVGAMIGGVLKTILTMISNKIKFDEEMAAKDKSNQAESDQEENEEESQLNQTNLRINSISATESTFNKIINLTLGTVQKIITGILLVLMSFLALFLFLV